MIKYSELDLSLIQRLEDEAYEKFMDIDWETLSLVPFTGYTKTWPEGDRNNRFDYEGGSYE